MRTDAEIKEDLAQACQGLNTQNGFDEHQLITYFLEIVVELLLDIRFFLWRKHA